MKPFRDPNRPKVPELAPLIAAVYSSPNGGAGCCLHVVTDDANWKSTDFVLAEARRRGHPDCIAAAEMMVKMTQSQIARASSRGQKMADEMHKARYAASRSA